MSRNSMKLWLPIVIVFLAGGIVTALVPQTVPILGAIAKAFNVSGASLGWVVSFPTMACAFGALAFGVVVDRLGDVRLLLVGIALVILGDAGVSLAPGLDWLYAARLFQGFGYVSISVAAPTFIQRTTTGDMRRAAMALWAAHTPVGFAAAVFVGAQFVAAGFSWRVTFLPHAAAALVVGLAALTLTHAPTAAKVSRSAGTRRVLASPRAYAVSFGSLAAANLQVGVMVMVPAMLAEAHGFTGPQSAVVVVFAMLANLAGAMVIVATRLRNVPRLALPISAVLAAFFAFVIVTGMATDLTMKLACVMLFAATIGTANALVWSLLPAAVPSPEAAGATAGLMTQATFLGVLVSPPTWFWIRHESPLLVAALALTLTVLMVLALYAQASAGRSGSGQVLHAAH